jgi:16S rRNA (cytidine1402-2'-O)-methyltransferase
MGILYLVATPIGNLEDMSPRAVRILRQVSLIAAEDTRQTQKLLHHFGISTPLVSYFEHNKISRLELILNRLNEDDVALVSDAGTPTINDPGYELVRAALAAGHSVCPIPGPSAPITALAVSGLPTDAFLYLGYLPRKSAERRPFLETVADLPYTLLCLEVPHRLLASLSDLEAVLGDRTMAAARELTKIHEQIIRGPISRVRAHFEQHEPRGEFVLVIAGKTENRERWAEERIIQAIRAGLTTGESSSRLAARLAGESGWTRREVYRLIQANKEKV